MVRVELFHALSGSSSYQQYILQFTHIMVRLQNLIFTLGIKVWVFVANTLSRFLVKFYIPQMSFCGMYHTRLKQLTHISVGTHNLLFHLPEQWCRSTRNNHLIIYTPTIWCVCNIPIGFYYYYKLHSTTHCPCRKMFWGVLIALEGLLSSHGYPVFCI